MKDAASFPRTQKRKILFVDIVGKNVTLNSLWAASLLDIDHLPVRNGHCLWFGRKL